MKNQLGDISVPQETLAGRLLRVAAYCRVSSETEEQASSLDSQIAYYTKRIKQRDEWIGVGVFSDRGSGRNTKKRPGFVELMGLCRMKQVDLILTKSISRFGRNTLDSLRAMRELKALGIVKCPPCQDTESKKHNVPTNISLRYRHKSTILIMQQISRQIHAPESHSRVTDEA